MRDASATSSPLLEVAVRIGDRLLTAASSADDGIYWETPVHGPDGVRRVAWEGVYSGAAGVALFLLELFRLTGAVRFAETAAGALRWAEARVAAGAELGDSFMRGRTGVAAALLRLGELTGDDTGKRALAVALAAGGDGEGTAALDYLDGAAGALWGFSHLYHRMGDPRLRTRAEKALGRLLRDARVAENGGLAWLEEGMLGMEALAGLSHGSSGMALALLEARGVCAAWSTWAAEQALRFEDARFDPEARNWRDLRVVWTEDSLRDAVAMYRRDPRHPIVRGRADLVAWCHGAAGVAVGRLRAWEATGHAVHRAQAEMALDTTRRALRKPFDAAREDAGAALCLCHGRCGNAAVLLAGARALGDASLAGAARAVAEEAACWAAGPALPEPGGTAPWVPGLFMGIAGIGYFLLEAHDPLGTPSLLAPALSAGATATGADPAPGIGPWIVARQSWRCTAAVLEREIPDVATRLAVATRASGDLRTGFRAVVSAAGASLSGVAREQLREAWRLDRRCERLYRARISNAHTLVESMVLAADANAALEAGVELAAEVRWGPQVAVVRAAWPWDRVRAGAPLPAAPEQDSVTLLLLRRPDGVVVRRLATVEAALFAAARGGATVEALLAHAEAAASAASDDAADPAEALAALLGRGELTIAPAPAPGGE